jgi:hypothetical protein
MPAMRAAADTITLRRAFLAELRAHNPNDASE